MSATIRPRPLKPGDTVAIVPTARAVTAEEVMDAIALFEGWGLRVRLGAGIGRKHFQQAGTEAERTADLQAAIDDPQVRAIWCARGGYGTVRLLDGLRLAALRNDPKWIIGFSDITVLHNALNRLGIASLHAQMAFLVGAKSEATRLTLRQALFGEAYVIDHPFPDGTPFKRHGVCEGVLVGGNLSLLYALRGTPYDIDPKGKILLLEDLDELLYHLDRMMLNLRLAGWFKELAGLVVGGMTDMRNKNEADPFGMSPEEIIWDAVKDFGYPVCFGFPSGHVDDNRALILGENAKLSVTANGATLSFGGSQNA